MLNKPNDLIRFTDEVKLRLPENTRIDLQQMLDQYTESTEEDHNIIGLLSQYENVLPWMGTKSSTIQTYLKTLGDEGRFHQSILALPTCRVWKCPSSGCDNSWPVIDIGETPPICQDHNVPMVLTSVGVS